MMRKFLVALLATLLFIGQPNISFAAVGNTFDPGSPNPRALKVKILASLAADSKGNRPVSVNHASPKQFLEMLKLSDPDAKNLNAVADLPAYLDSLEVVDAPEGRHWMACLKPEGKGYTAVWDCLAREFHKGEKAWMNPVTKKIVFARDCANPVGVPDAPEEECVTQIYDLRKGDELHWAWLGDEALPDSKCTALLKAGEDEWSNLLVDECPREKCDFRRAAHDLGDVKIWAKPRISFVAEQDGLYKVRLSRRVMVSMSKSVACVVRSNGRQTMGKVIGGGAYKQGEARIGYKGRTVTPKSWNGLLHTWNFTDGKTE